MHCTRYPVNCSFVCQSGDAVEVCEQGVEANDRFQRGKNQFRCFYHLV